MKGLDILGAVEIGAVAPAQGPLIDVFTNPSDVILNTSRAQSTKYAMGTIARVEVSGGKRSHPFYGDATLAGYDHPASVSLTLANGKKSTIKNLEFLTVHGGKQQFDTHSAPSSIWSFLRIGDAPCPPLTHCTDPIVGDITDTKTDYDSGERLCLEMNQYFTALGRPKEFEPAAEAVWKAYENAKAGILFTATEKFMNATKMKNAGIDAAKVTADLQHAYPAKAAVLPSSNLPKPSTSFLGQFAFPWWGYAIGATATLGVAAYFLLPAYLARRTAKALVSK